MSLKLMAIMSSLIILVSCATEPPFVRASVDAFGDGGISKQVKLHFSKSNIEMQDKHIIALCEKAAMTKEVNILPNKCTENNCLNVFTTSRLNNPIRKTSINAGTNSWGGYVSTSDYVQREREIKLSFRNGRSNKEVHSVVVRSSGQTNSVAGVALEMCKAAFVEYPKHLTTKYYEVNVIR